MKKILVFLFGTFLLFGIVTSANAVSMATFDMPFVSVDPDPIPAEYSNPQFFLSVFDDGSIKLDITTPTLFPTSSSSDVPILWIFNFDLIPATATSLVADTTSRWSEFWPSGSREGSFEEAVVTASDSGFDLFAVITDDTVDPGFAELSPIGPWYVNASFFPDFTQGFEIDGGVAFSGEISGNITNAVPEPTTMLLLGVGLLGLAGISRRRIKK